MSAFFLCSHGSVFPNTDLLSGRADNGSSCKESFKIDKEKEHKIKLQKGRTGFPNMEKQWSEWLRLIDLKKYINKNNHLINNNIKENSNKKQTNLHHNNTCDSNINSNNSNHNNIDNNSNN